MKRDDSAAGRGDTRRGFLTKSGAAAAALAGARMFGQPAEATVEAAAQASAAVSPQPWYRRTVRWMQTNIAEIDATRYDIPWWREHWRQTQTQGVVVNAGGIVAYYPTE